MTPPQKSGRVTPKKAAAPVPAEPKPPTDKFFVWYDPDEIEAEDFEQALQIARTLPKQIASVDKIGPDDET
jgi:hypothetical protein